MKTPLYIIVLTYNGGGDLPLFLSSLRACTKLQDIVLIAVDNASQDESVAYIRTHFPEACIIQNTENLGYAGGNNVGMRYALDQGAEYIMLANQDLVFEQGWLPAIRHHIETHPGEGAVQSRIMLYDDKTLLNSYGNALHYLGYGYTRGYRMTPEAWHSYDIAHKGEMPFFNCSGAALILRAEALRAIGLFGEEYFMYHEDTDLSWRMRLAGYTLGICEESIVYHRYEFSKSITKFYYIERNRLITIIKNYHIGTLILITPMLAIMELGMLVYSLAGVFKGSVTLGLREKLRGYRYFLSWHHLVLLWRTRKEVQALRRISDREITRHMTAVVSFQDIQNPLVTYVANPLMALYWRLARSIIFW